MADTRTNQKQNIPRAAMYHDHRKSNKSKKH